MPSSSCRALLVENNLSETSWIRKFLGDSGQPGLQLSTAATFLDALQWLGTYQCDIIFLDMNLPDSDGLEMLGQLVTRHPQVTVVVLMDIDDHFQEEQVLQRGAWDYLTKSHIDIDGYAILRRSIRYVMERRRVLEQLNARQNEFINLVDHNVDGVLVINHHGRVCYINSAARMLFGQKRVEIGDEFGFPIVIGSIAELDIVPIPGEKPKVIEMRVAQTVWEGLPAQLASLRDITLRKKTERDLQRAKHEAEASNRAKSMFLASMSHEIRTPMNAILGLVHLINQTEMTPEQSNYTAKITTAARSLLGILNDILDFSKIEAGRLEVDHIDFRLATLLDDLATIISGSAAAKDLETSIVIDSALPQWLKGDPSRLQQVLINLAGNAIKFTEIGMVAVYVTLVQGEHPMVRFAVKDTGIGIGSDQIEHLFQPFGQVDSSNARRFGGSGLGLAISKRLVELMGGEIGVASVLNQGSEFWFRLPLIEGQVPGSEPVSTLASLSVLVADDDEIGREALSSMVSFLGWNGTVVTSGQEVIDHLRDDAPYDVLLVDWRMPGMDGLETSRRIRTEFPMGKVPIVIIATAYHREFVLQSPNAELVDAVLMKPVSPSTLYNSVLEIENRYSGGTMARNSKEGECQLVGIRILVVEDNPINREVAQRILENNGARVEIVENGSEALVWLRRQATDIDLVLMDAQMPVMDGFEATRRIRHDLGLTELPVIALSAGVRQSERGHCLEAGMNDFVAKPLDVDILIETILRYTRTRPDAVGFTESLPPTAISSVKSPLTAIPGLDLPRALMRLGGDEVTLLRLLWRLVDNNDAFVFDLRQSLQQGLDSESAQILHKLRGGAANLGLERLSELASTLEMSILEQRMNRAPALLDELEGELSTIKAALPPADGNNTLPVLPLEREKMERLVTLLREENLEAVTLYEQIAPALTELLGQERTQSLARVMEKLELDQALDIIEHYCL